MASYRAFATPGALLRPYATLALQHRKAKDREDIDASISQRTPKPVTDIGNTVALLTLNAAILEGTLRLLLSEHLFLERERAVKEGIAAGRTDCSRDERWVAKFQDSVETQGGFDTLKERYKEYFDTSPDEAMKQTDPKLLDAIQALFYLRNVFAHGTTLVQPATPMPKSEADGYPYIWQRKAETALKYLKREFSGQDLFALIAHHDVPEHFWKCGVKMLEAVIAVVGPQEQTSELMGRFRKYSFGYRM